MEKKVYEGYKRTSKSDKATTTVAKVSSTTKKASVPQSAVPKKTSSKVTSKPNAKPAGKSAVTKPRLAMFIDVDNVGISRENLLEILFYANGKYQIELCKLYGFNDDTLPGVREIANEYNVVTVGRMKFKQTGVDCLDSRLLVDAYECALNNKNKIDMIFVWCYPCDLANLFEKIIALGVNTSTINNSIFDCKNKFVSQTFKLYSPYEFTMDQTTYGKVKNQPSEIAPSATVDAEVNTAQTTPTPAETPTKTQTSTETPATTTTNSVNTTAAQDNNTPPPPPGPIDGVIPPILPRRTILERSNPNAPRPKPEPETETESEQNEATESKPSSMIEEIARKLNLKLPSEVEEESSSETSSFESSAAQSNNSSFMMDMLKQAGFGDLVGEEKNLKYEDTIGDL